MNMADTTMIDVIYSVTALDRQRNDDDEIDFDAFYEWVTNDIQTLNGYEFAVDVFYPNEG
jgi:uncharacterized protein YegL